MDKSNCVIKLKRKVEGIVEEVFVIPYKNLEDISDVRLEILNNKDNNLNAICGYRRKCTMIPGSFKYTKCKDGISNMQTSFVAKNQPVEELIEHW